MDTSQKTAHKKTVVILGGFGFIGQHITNELTGRGYTALAVSRKNNVDLLNLDQTQRYLLSVHPDIIINCASHKGSVHYVSRAPATILDDDLRMVLNLYKAVSVSSPQSLVINLLPNCTYPGNAVIQKESHWLSGPVHPSVLSYGNMKRITQVLSECYAIECGLKTKNFIIPNAYGPGDHLDPDRTHAFNGMIIRMMKAEKQNASKFVVWGTGKPKREWIYAGDVARFIAEKLDGMSPDIHPINIAQNKAYSVAAIASKIKNAIGFRGALVFDDSYIDGAPVKKLDDTKFRSTYPEFHFTPMRIGILNTISYYNTHI